MPEPRLRGRRRPERRAGAARWSRRDGVDEMQRAPRARRPRACWRAGRRRLCQALAITGEHDGLSLDRPPFELRGREQSRSTARGGRAWESAAPPSSRGATPRRARASSAAPYDQRDDEPGLAALRGWGSARRPSPRAAGRLRRATSRWSRSSLGLARASLRPTSRGHDAVQRASARTSVTVL